MTPARAWQWIIATRARRSALTLGGASGNGSAVRHRQLQGDLLQEVERPELAAVPDHAFPQHYDGRDQNELNIGAGEGLFPWILGHCPLGLDLLEYRRFLKMHPDIVGDEHQQEREQERERASPSR